MDVPDTPELTVDPDLTALRSELEELSTIHRPSASEGERVAAEWLVGRLRDVGVESARVETEPQANGTYWWPLGLLAGAGALAGVAARRGGARTRALAALTGAAATALAIDELPPGSRTFRRRLPDSAAHQVLGEIGDPQAENTIVLMAHHDTAHSGLIFDPRIPDTIHRLAPSLMESAETSPPLMFPVVGGQAVVALGAALGSDRLLKLGTAVCAGTALAMADIGRRPAVPGANDNGTAVIAVVELAKALIERPPENTKILVLSTSEEALCEGMGIFMDRYRDRLPKDRTFFLSLDTIGSPHLTVLRGEGMFRMKDYPVRSLELVDGLAGELGIELFPNLRLRNATDGVFPLNEGYQCISMASCTDLKQPSNYHWPTDTADRVDYGTVADGIRLAEAVIRRLDADWIPGPA